MNRIDRLLGYILLFQKHGRLRAEDLAAAFEISRRTVYRDIHALSELGVPVVTWPGQGYTLMEGYFLPPLLFTPDEAAALVLGATLLAQQARGQWPGRAARATAKVTAILPAETRQRVDRLLEIIEFYLPHQTFDLEEPRLTALQRAIHERRAVRLSYTSYGGAAPTERVIEPERLTYGEGQWYITGFCRLRDAERSFRLERIDSLLVLDERFTPRPSQPEPSPLVEARVRFVPSVRRWVREQQHYGFVHESGDEMIYRVQEMGELGRWLLGWGRAVEAISPAALRHLVRDEAQQLVERLT